MVARRSTRSPTKGVISSSGLDRGADLDPAGCRWILLLTSGQGLTRADVNKTVTFRPGRRPAVANVRAQHRTGTECDG
jgi:hypothetical protein